MNNKPFFLGLLSCFAVVAASAQNVPAAPREMEPLKARYAADVVAAITPVKARYEQQLQGLMKSLTTKADLNGALAVKNEVEWLSLGGPAPAASASPREMGPLKARYAADVQVALKPIKDRYEKQLQALTKSLTTKDDLAGALAVKNEIESLSIDNSTAAATAVAGYWRFGNGAAMQIKDDGAVANPKSPKAGRWNWTDTAKREFIIRWENHSDTLTLSDDGEKLTGISSTNVSLQVERITKREFAK